MLRGRARLAVACATIAAMSLAASARSEAATSTTQTTANRTTTTVGATSTTTDLTSTTTAPATLPPLPTTPEPAAWILVDADTGHVLEGHNIHTPHRPASMVKVTTALAGLERLPPTAEITVSQDAVSHGVENENPSGMKVGQQWTVAQLVTLMMIISANDAAYALAQGASGTIPQFAADETRTAHQLGMRDSTFNDPSGLNDTTSYQGGPEMSPYDVAISVRDALHIPEIAIPAGTARYTYTDPGGITHNVTSHNQMLPTLPHAYSDATGFKTGATQLSGDTLAATAARGGRTLIAVIMDSADRYNWAKALFERGFDTQAAATGLGEKLPAVQDLTYTHRASVKAAAVKFLTGTAGLGTATSLPGETATSYHPATTTTHKPAVAAAHRSNPSKSSSSGGLSAVEIALIVFAVLLLAIVALRRRAVRRQRARRAARRQSQAALRRGSLPVVDGRYRAGMRTGPSPQSNVRVRRDDD